jgi:hypothetical protein
MGQKNTIMISLNGKEINTSDREQSSGLILETFVPGMLPDANNTCTIACLKEGVAVASSSVVIYCEKSSIFDPIISDSVVLLNSEGRTNETSLVERSKWNYSPSSDTTIESKLTGFNWVNNGWVAGDDGRTCLRITNGAKVEIPFNLFGIEGLTGFTFDLEFKPYNLYTYDLLTQSTVTTEQTPTDPDNPDEIVTVTRGFNSEKAIISYTTHEVEGQLNDTLNPIGFFCGTQDAFFRMSNGDHAAVRYTDNTIVTISVSVNLTERRIYMYVNGILSGVSSFSSNANLPTSVKNLIINSDYCDIDLYNVRAYKIALDS